MPQRSVVGQYPLGNRPAQAHLFVANALDELHISGTLTYTQTAVGPQTFTVQTTGDGIDEGTGETFTVAISSPSGGGGPAPSLGMSKSVATTITDDDTPSGITLLASRNSLGEDDAATTVTVTAILNGSTTRTEATVVTIGTLGGTATEGSPGDYTATTPASIIIPGDSSTVDGTLTITPTDDVVVEGGETITLTDDDKSTTVPGDKDSAEISITGPASSVLESGDAVFTVTLSSPVAADVTVEWSALAGRGVRHLPESGASLSCMS